MKKSLILLAALLGFANLSFADTDTNGKKPDNTIIMKLTPETKIEAGKESKIKLTLSDTATGQPVTMKDLETVHTKKFHLLAIEPTLTDYNHIHPSETKTPGEYEFSFKPEKAGTYRFWADLTPTKTKTQQYVTADIGENSSPAIIDKKETNEATIGGYNFKLSFENSLQEGSSTIGTIKVTDKKGKPVEYLEPVLGAFAHIVCFSEDYKTIVHIHPMGKEPESANEKGGPELEFHIAPETSGFVKLFVQVKIKGKTLFVPFGLNIKYPTA